MALGASEVKFDVNRENFCTNRSIFFKNYKSFFFFLFFFNIDD